MNLYEIFTEYRSGNTAVLDTLLDNSDLKRMAHNTYNDYSNNCNIEKTKTTKIYTGNEDDVRMLFSMQFLDMLEDNDYNPKDQQQLCTNLKYMAGGKVRNELVEKEYCFENMLEDYYNDLPSPLHRFDKLALAMWNSGNTGYTRQTKELLNIIKRVDITELLNDGAVFQKNLVHLLSSDDVWLRNNKGYELQTLDDIGKEYTKVYGGTVPFNSQISEAKANIRNRLVKCVSVVGGECDIDIHYMLSDETERIIQNACKLNQSANSEYGIAFKNLIDRVECTVKALLKKEFQPDTEKITDIALFEYDKQDYWHFKVSGKRYRIEKFNRTGSRTYSPRRSRRIEFTKPPVCYVIGNCVIYGDVDSKELYYLPKGYHLIDVIQKDNKYYGFCLDS